MENTEFKKENSKNAEEIIKNIKTIKMNVCEDTNLTASVVLTIEGQTFERQIMFMSANLNADTFALNININVNDKDLYMEYSEVMKEKYIEFKKQVEERAKQLGYIIF